MTRQPEGSVVAGVDLTTSSRRAVEEGIRHARLLHRPLHLLYAAGIGLVPWTPDYLADKSEHLRRHADDAAHRAADLAVTFAVHAADPAALLVSASRSAKLVVVGSAGLPRVADAVRRATARKVISHAHCPVLVAPHAGSWDGAGPVVVGVDQDDLCVPALTWAFDHASRTGAHLVPVHAWWWEPPNAYLAGTVWGDRWDEIEEAEGRVLAERLAGWRERYPGVSVRPTLVRGKAGTALQDLSGSSRIIVVGTRGRGGFAGLLLGSVSDHIAHRAHCPVVVVPSVAPSRPSRRAGSGRVRATGEDQRPWGPDPRLTRMEAKERR